MARRKQHSSQSKAQVVLKLLNERVENVVYPHISSNELGWDLVRFG
jgi:hypothetical protein